MNLQILHLRVRNLRNIDSTVSVKELGNLFQRGVSRLHNEEVNNTDFKEEKYAVEDVVFPSESFKCNCIHILVEEECCRDAEVEPCEALGTDAVGQDLCGVGSQKTGSEEDCEYNMVDRLDRLLT